MLREIHGANFINIKFLDRNNFKCQNGPVLPPPQIFYFNAHALHKIIDLVLIDPHSVGKRTHDLMDTVNAKKRWKTIYWRVNKYLK
jgi:hypothetical protein